MQDEVKISPIVARYVSLYLRLFKESNYGGKRVHLKKQLKKLEERINDEL